MAIIPETQYVGKIAPSTSSYPYGEARNITTPGDGTGTPWEAALVNDLWGFLQGMLASASIVPSGSPDTALVSQYRSAAEFLNGRVVLSIAALGALVPVATGQMAFLTDPIRGGKWRWDGSDLSTEVAADTLEGLYKAPDSDATGASGAWVRVLDGYVTFEMFGAVGDGTTNDAAAIQAAVNAGVSIVRGGQKTYLLSSTVVVPVGVFIVGVSSQDYRWFNPTSFVPDALSTSFYEADGSQTANGYLFFMNVATGAPTTWIQQFPNIGAGGISHCEVNGTNTGNIKLAYFAGGYEFDDIRCHKVSTAVRSVDSLYIDHISVKRIFAVSRANQTDYFVYLNTLGDSIIVEDISSGYTGAQTGITKGIYLGLHTGGRVHNLINGSHYFAGSRAIDVGGLHQEGGNVTIDDASINLHSSLFFLDEDQNVPIIVKSTNGVNGDRYQTVIENCEFAKAINNFGGWPLTEVPDISVETNAVNLIIGKGNQRTYFQSGTLAKKQSMGIIVSNSASSVTDWESYSHMLTKDGTTITGTYTEITGEIPSNDYAFAGWTGTVALSTISGATFAAPSATYFYGILLLSDPVRRIGRTASTPEISGAVTLGGDIPTLTLALGSIPRPGGFIARVYRGTATGSYTAYVDIPAICLRLLYDDGNALNGFPWKARAASGVDTINYVGLAGAISMRSEKVDCSASSAVTPTAGTWKIGDRVRQMTPVIDGSSMVVDSFIRLTSGSAHVSGTDWATGYVSHVSPAV